MNIYFNYICIFKFEDVLYILKELYWNLSTIAQISDCNICVEILKVQYKDKYIQHYSNTRLSLK